MAKVEGEKAKERVIKMLQEEVYGQGFKYREDATAVLQAKAGLLQKGGIEEIEALANSGTAKVDAVLGSAGKSLPMKAIHFIVDIILPDHH